MLIVKVDELIDKVSDLNAEIERLRDALYPPFEITEGVVMTADEVRSIFREHLPHDTFWYELLDVSFFIPAYEDIAKIIVWDTVDRKPYMPERRDCDDYGMYMAAMASIQFGINPFFPVWDFDACHFYDLIISAERALYVFEPQTDAIRPFSEFVSDPLHKLNRGKIYGF